MVQALLAYQQEKDEATELEKVRTQRSGNMETDCITIFSSEYCLRVNCLHVQSAHFSFTNISESLYEVSSISKFVV